MTPSEIEQEVRRYRKVLAWLLLSALLEVVFGWALLGHSRALLADAGHLLCDKVAVLVALFSALRQHRFSESEQAAGQKRASKIIAGLLILPALWIFWGAVFRLKDPPEVDGGWMLAVVVASTFCGVRAYRILKECTCIRCRAMIAHAKTDIGLNILIFCTGLAAAINPELGVADAPVSMALAIFMVWVATRILLGADHEHHQH